MKIAAISTGGQHRTAVVEDAGLVDLADLGVAVSGFSELWAAWPEHRSKIIAGLRGEVPRVAAADVTWLPPVDGLSTFWAAAANYEGHLREGGFARPDYPPFFLRHAGSLVGHHGEVHKPWFSERLDYEGELAVVIGRPARFVCEEQALDYVAGYTCFNDGSVRDWQRHTGQITVGKNFARSGALGPWITTADEAGEVDNALLTTTVNGRVLQSSKVGEAIWGIRYVVSYLSAVTELRPGDVIALGTPAGVGGRQDPPLFLHAGDVVEIAIEDVGVLTHSVVETPASDQPWPAGVR